MTAGPPSPTWIERLFNGKQGLNLGALSAKTPVSGRFTTDQASRLKPKQDYPAVVIGSGLGGLTAAAYLARSGFKVTVIEQAEKPGGYATSFSRGCFNFEVSLHATSVKDNPPHRILEELGVLDLVRFEKLPELHRILTPAHDVTFPHADAEAYKRILVERFPGEEKGIRAFVDLIVGAAEEVDRLSRRNNHFVKILFPLQYKRLWSLRYRTLQDLLDVHVKNSELRCLLSAIWPYYGLPPSRLSAFFFSVGTGDYINKGGFYPRGRSQDISAALATIIEENGGNVVLGRKVERILTRNGAAIGVVDSRGKRYLSRAVISNASAPTTMLKMLPRGTLKNGFKDRLRVCRPSLSSFVVWLGLDQDLTRLIPQAEVFLTTCHDPEVGYAHALNMDAQRVPLVFTVYDNIFRGYSPRGKTTASVMCLCGYQYWKRYEKDYRAGRKDAYYEDKERIASILVERVEEALVPGLSDMIEEYEVATPLTNVRYTGNPEGAIYGYEQSLQNSFLNRLENRTPVRYLYLASSWGTPGGGFAGAMRSGQQTYRCLIDDWYRSG